MGTLILSAYAIGSSIGGFDAEFRVRLHGFRQRALWFLAGVPSVLRRPHSRYAASVRKRSGR
jgi:hypothetical protein